MTDPTSRPSPYRLGVLLTCHDRRETTLGSLEHLFACDVPPDVRLEVFLVDDGSRDGTAEAVARRFPSVHLLHGDGSLFWAGGTRKAMEAARDAGVDAHVWLNDDAKLFPSALEDLMTTYDALRPLHGPATIVVGSMRDPATHESTYGGVVRASGWHPLKFERLEPGDEPRECEAMNGNLVLIPREVADRIGILSEDYVHAIGDFGYGLEARRAGASIWICPGYQGECARNDPTGGWEDPDVPLLRRLRMLSGPKGLPLRSYSRMARFAGARPLPFFVMLPYARVLVTSLLSWRRSGPRGESA